MSKNVQVKQLETDILIIGGGTAGCYAAFTIAKILIRYVIVEFQNN